MVCGSMLTMGEKSAKVCCVIVATGQGPVVSVEPATLDFGQVQVLAPVPMNLLVSNESPIPAGFRATLVRFPPLFLS